MTQLAEHSTLDISQSAIELEESILGAILLDPGAIAAVEKLPAKAFSISAHQQIYLVMQELHHHNLKPDLLTVVSTSAEKGILNQVGGKAKLASLLDRTVHSFHIKQHASLLQQKYDRRMVSDRMNQLASSALKAEDIDEAISFAQLELEKIRSVTGDSRLGSDSSISDRASFSPTVTTVTKILKLGLPQWEERDSLDTVQKQSGLSKESFALLVASVRCQEDEVTPADKEELSQLFEWKNATLDFGRVLPHIADDLLHDASVLNIEPIMLWQYLLPAVLSLVGKKVNLDVRSHTIPAIIWTCCVAESGTGKSRAEGLILAPLKAWQQKQSERFKRDLVEYKQCQNKKDDTGEPLTPPPAERKYLFDVATIQAIMKRLSEQKENGSLWARDEIAGLFKSLNQFSAKGEGEGLECLLPTWDGVSNWVDRVLHEDSYYLANSRLSIAGGIQPGVFRKIFADADDAQGIQARFLFAQPKIRPAKRVEGYCRLSDKLPQLYSWIDTQFPTGNIRLSSAANSKYTTLYESIGCSAEMATTPSVRAWMRKLPGQLLRIALALHIIECYHEPGRPRHELQVDTLNRAADFCRYYRSVFQAVQQSVSDSDSIVNILDKIWDKAVKIPTGLLVRDAHRSIKALSHRAKEQRRDVGAYTIDLFYQLQKMGKGVVKRSGRAVRFVAGIAPLLAQPQCSATERMTVATANEAVASHSLDVSPQEIVSPVTHQKLEQIECYLTLNNMVSSPHVYCDYTTLGNRESDGQADMGEETPVVDKDTVSDRAHHPTTFPTAYCNFVSLAPTAITKPLNEDEQLLNQTELESWLNQIANVGSAEDCLNCLEVLNSLPSAVTEQIWSSAEPLLPRFWAVASSESLGFEENQSGDSKHNQGNNCSIKEEDPGAAKNLVTPTIDDRQKQNPGQGTSSKVSPQQPHKLNWGDSITSTPLADKPKDRTASAVKELITGLWVRTSDNFYGHLGAMVTDGRWWVLFPKSRTADAQSRLYAAVDIIPMPNR